MTLPRRHLAPALPALLALLSAAAPALAQEGWHNPYTGRNWNNPGSSLIDTFLQNDARRRMLMQPGSGSAPQAAAAPAAPARGADPSFRLTNRGPATLRELYVSPTQSSQWGPDRLGTGMLPAGRAVIVQLPAGACENDIRAVFADGRVAERRRVDTCGLTDLALP